MLSAKKFLPNSAVSREEFEDPVLHNALATYDLLRLNFSDLPEPSPFYNLIPVSIGDSLVESSTSYVSRLAVAHGVSTRTLIFHKVLPYLGKTFTLDGGDRTKASFWSRYSHWMNGIKSWARSWVNAIESLTLRRDISFLTMLNFSEVLASEELLRHKKAWCPLCYDEWREKGKVVYDPLLWTLDIVKICVKHRTRLVDICHFCHSPITILSVYSQPGYCANCDNWLGNNISSEDRVNDCEVSETEFHIWAADSVAETLAAIPRIATFLTKSRISQVINEYAQKLTGGNVSDLARYIQLPKGTVSNWHRGSQLPRIQAILWACFRLNVSLFDFLTGHIEPDRELRTSFAEFFEIKNESQIVEVAHHKTKEEIKKYLQEKIRDFDSCPLPMCKVAQHLGRNHRVLISWFPEECSEISRLYKSFQAFQRNNRAARAKPPVEQNLLSRPGKSKKRTKLNDEEILIYLENILEGDEIPPLSMAEVARRLNCDHAALIRNEKFREQCQRISRKYREYRNVQKLERLQSDYKKVEMAMTELHNQGIYPNQSKVARKSGKTWIFIRIEVRDFWRKKIDELSSAYGQSI